MSGKWPSVFVLSLVIGSCGGGRDRHLLASRADSLAASVQVFAMKLNAIDTAAIDSMILGQETWIRFIARHIHDTLSMGEAGSIQRFSEAGDKVRAAMINRGTLLNHANILSAQLKSLAADLRSGSIDPSGARQFLVNETASVQGFSTQADRQLRNYHSAVEQYRQNAVAVGDIVRDHNQGELPLVVEHIKK